jgi:PAS domain S-box-containing protein
LKVNDAVSAADTSERVRSDNALRVSEESYRAIFDAAEDAILVHDIETAAIVDANPKACTTFGYSLEEFHKLELGALGPGVPPYTQQDAMKLFARAVAGEELRIEWLSKSKVGILRWHEVCAKRVTIGGQDRVLSLGRDITDRKLAEAALRASQEQYHAIFCASIDGLALWTASGKIVDTNPALWRIYGYSGEEPSPLPPHGYKGPSYDAQFLQAVAAGESLRLEVTQLRADGCAAELEVHGIPMQYQGKPHVLTITRDITDKKRSAAELARQREALYQREKLAALGSLLAGVAHELNNPLSVVVARAVLLEEQGDPATLAAAAKIRTAAERCARIVRTFLAMARQQPSKRGPVAVNDVVTAALDIAGYAIRTSGIEVKLSLSPDIPHILADADQLHQVLLNLIINAQQCLQDHPLARWIRIDSQFDAIADMVTVTVADTGPGIPVHLRSRLFEPYFTTKPTGMGTGVGLAVSLGIVEAHGGTLTVDCPASGGAAFTFTLPARIVSATRASAEPSWQSSTGQGAVLIVDDEPEIRETLADILSNTHRVVAASSGREALERMEKENFDIALMDIRMPDLDGRALYQEIERRWPGHGSRVVFVTGDTLTSTLRDFVSESGRPVIEKPFLPSDVRRVVAELARDGGVAAPD